MNLLENFEYTMYYRIFGHISSHRQDNARTGLLLFLTDEIRNMISYNEVNTLIDLDLPEWNSVYTLGYPILKQYNMKATVFIVTRSIADYGNHVNFPHMSWAQMNSATDVFTYGSHTDSLHYANKYGKSDLLYTDTASLIADLIKSRNILNNTLYFAYPYGDYDARVIITVQKAGYNMAFTTHERYVYVGDSMYAIPRFTIDADMDRFIEVVTGKAWPILHPAFMPVPKRTVLQ